MARKRGRKLGMEQKRLLAEFLTNVAVAWFSGGVITGAFGYSQQPRIALLIATEGLGMSILFLISGLYLIKGVKL